MKILASILSASVLAASVAACDQTGAPSQDQELSEKMPMDTAEAPPTSNLQADTMDNLTGHATGVIVSIAPDGESVKIDHGPFEGIDMGAMTMNFELMGDADLVELSEGDEVGFVIKRGRDGTYRIMDICGPAAGGYDCLERIKDN